MAESLRVRSLKSEYKVQKITRLSPILIEVLSFKSIIHDSI